MVDTYNRRGVDRDGDLWTSFPRNSTSLVRVNSRFGSVARTCVHSPTFEQVSSLNMGGRVMNHAKYKTYVVVGASVCLALAGPFDGGVCG